MRKHRNPYRINDPDNLFEVCENSSHPELQEKKRFYEFQGRVFRTATELEKHMKNYGHDPRRYGYMPRWEKDTWGTVIRIKVVERCPENERHMMRSFDEAANY